MRNAGILTLLLAFLLTLSGCGALSGLTGETSAFALEVGMCFNDASESADTVSTVPEVECTEPHDNEVYHLVDYEEGDFPGVEAITAFADEQCLGAFEGYVGTDYDSSRLGYTYLSPTEGSWADGDREIACTLYDGQLGKLTGSMRDSGE